MQLIRCLLSNFYPNMFRASLCPSSGEQERVLLHMVFCTDCVGCSNIKLHTVHTAYDPAPHNHSQHNQYRTPYAVIHGPVLLMMGIMMPETCWERSLIINIGLVASCWILHSWFRASLQLFQNKHQQDDTYGLSFISRLVVLHSTCFELLGAHHQEFTFSTLYRQSLA